MFFSIGQMEQLNKMSYNEGYTDGLEEGHMKGYDEGYKDAYTAAQLSIAERVLERADKALEGLEDENRRLEQVYKWAYEQGALDALAHQGIVDIDDIVKELEKGDIQTIGQE